MAIQATFTADTKPLEAGLERAAAKIAGTKRASEDAGRALKAMGSSFDGTRTEGTALRLAASIQKVGGAVRLTDTEWKRADRTVADVLQKYERMGTVAPAAIQALRRELDAVKASATQANAALTGVASSTTAAGARGGLGAIGGGLGLGIGAGLGLGALTALSGVVKELASDATRLSPLSQSFERLQGGATNAERSLLALRVATKGLVSDADLLQAANKGSLLGLDAMGIQFDEVARIATVLGRAMGQDAAKSVDDLTTALARMSPQILDNLGIKVDLTKATEDYARSVKKSADELTEEEKKLAFATAAMEAAREKTAQLGEVQLTVAEQGERIAVAFADIATQAISAGNQSSTFAGKLGEVADALAKIRGAGVGTSFRVLASEAAGAVQRSVQPFLSPFNFGGALLYGAAGAVRDAAGVTQEDILGVLTGRPQRTTGAQTPRTPVAAPSRASGGATDAPARLKKVSDAQRDLNKQVADAFRTSRQAEQGWEEYAGSIELAALQMLQYAEAQQTANLGTISSARNPLSAIMNGPYLYQISDNMTAGVVDGTRKAQAATRDWRNEIRGASQAFASLAQIAGPALDGIARGFATGIGATGAAGELITSLGKLFPSLVEDILDENGKVIGQQASQRGRNLSGLVGAASAGFALGGTTSNIVLGGALGAGGGLTTGLLAGATGATLGATAGIGAAAAIYMAWRNRQAEKKALSQQRAEVIASAGGYDEFQKAVERAGFEFDYFLQKFNSNNADTFTEAMNRLNVAMAEQESRSAKLTQGLQNVAKAQGVLSQQQIAQIRTLKPGDSAGAGIVEFAEGQRAQAERGLLAVVSALDSYGDEALGDFEGAARGAAAGLAALFGESLAAGESAIDIIGRLGGAMNTLADLFSKSGITPGAGFAQIQDLASILANPQTAGAVQTAQGLGQALAGFYNTGVFAAFPELFADIANGIGSAWKALENFGAGGQRGAALLQPYLQNLWEIIDANPHLREQLDEQTRSLLEFAEANGLVGPQFRDAAEKMQDALQRLIDKLDEFIERMGTAAGLTFPAPGTPTAPTGPASPSAPPPPSSPGPNGGDYTTPGFAGGSNGVRDFGRESLVRLHGREVVQTEGQYEAMKAQGRISVRSNASAMSGVQQVITVQLGRETIARAVAEDLPRLVQVYGGAA